YPVIVAIINGLYKFELVDIITGERAFVGLENYVKLFSDERFLNALYITTIYTIVSLILSIVIGTLLALLIERPFKAKNIVRSLLLVPMIMAPAATGIIWKNFFFGPENGLINIFLNFFGISGPGWLISYPWALISVIFLETIFSIPLVMIIIDAGLMSIPNSIVDAAKIDGANYFRQVLNIKIPMIRSAFLMVLIFRISTSFRSFDFIYSTTMGGPGTNTETLGLYIYRLAIRILKISYASAASTFMGIIIGSITFILLIYIMRSGGERFWSK
ncbi:unnamed protein product, partial [marine sediment metagenome]